MHYLYRITNESGIIVYIGQTGNLKARCSDHPQAAAGDTLEFLEIENKSYALMAESSLIRHYLPVRNGQWGCNEQVSKIDLDAILSSEWSFLKKFLRTNYQLLAKAMQAAKNDMVFDYMNTVSWRCNRG